MPRTRLIVAVALLAAVTAAAATAVGRRRADSGPVDPPPGGVRLAVLIVFDQMRGDYVDRWRPLFGPGGFRRLEDDGAWFTDCNYPYATTATGPGHASVLSGTGPDHHGIVNNEWYDRAAGAEVYCAASDRYSLVPPPKAPPPGRGEGRKRPLAGGNPDRMLSPTLADGLKRATGGAGKVFGLSLKDRAAVLPVGKSPDGAYWFAGRFVTSTYYRDTLPPWAARFNATGAADRWFGVPWTRLRPDLDYVPYSGPDVVKGEAAPYGQGIAFPHPTDGGKKEVGKEYYDALADSPFGNELLLEFAKACVVAEKLGQDDVPDLLTVSFSSNDLIGHAWGPDSQEVLDVTLRSDRVVADFLKFLDERVGPGKYVVAVTADHGICPLPEVSAKAGRDAGRVPLTQLLLGAETHLRRAFGPPAGAADLAEVGKAAAKAAGAGSGSLQGGPGMWVENLSPPWFYLNGRQIRSRGLAVPAVAAELARWLRTQPGVLTTYTADALRGEMPADDAIGRRVQRSYFPGRCGDVCVVTKPYYLISDPVKGSGTSHGTPHPYDTAAPLLVYGPGIPGGRRAEPVTPLHTAAILARFLGVTPPRDAQYPVPATLFGQPAATAE